MRFNLPVVVLNDLPGNGQPQSMTAPAMRLRPAVEGHKQPLNIQTEYTGAVILNADAVLAVAP